MKIRELKDGSEYVLNEEGEFISCPVCNKNWSKNIEGDVVHGKCPHLRFSFCDEDGYFDVFNNWNGEEVANRFDLIIRKQVDEETFDGYDNVFNELLADEDVDEIVYWVWDDPPFINMVMFWGHVKN